MAISKMTIEEILRFMRITSNLHPSIDTHSLFFHDGFSALRSSREKKNTGWIEHLRKRDIEDSRITFHIGLDS
jgi:hypothetical protein